MSDTVSVIDPIWPADNPVRRSVDELIPYARNSRTHSDEQVSQIAASIREFGFTNPILIEPDNGIVAGHGRIMAAKKLGLREVPCIIAEGWSEAQKKAYVIWDNQSALLAGWDFDILKTEVGDLMEMNFDTDLLGFDDDFLAGLMAEPTEGLTDPEATPDVPVTPITEPGDVWILGKHRIVCGDSTNPDDVDKALNGVTPHLMVTDPPYGVEYDANWRNEAMPEKNDPNRWKDGSGRATGAVLNDDRADWSEAWALFPGDVAYVWHAGIHAGSVSDSLTNNDFKIRSQIIWAKSNMAIGRGDYHWQHEPCWYAVKNQRKGHYCGDRKQTTIWNIEKPQSSETGHSTQKPVECMARPIRNNSSPGQAVYEPFSGSGTTIIACEMEDRACHAIELNPAYVDVAVRRWQEFTGYDAEHEQDGRTFNEIAGEE